MVLIAHVSDIHVDAGERSAARAGRVFRYLAGLLSPPDAVIVTGDIADHGPRRSTSGFATWSS